MSYYLALIGGKVIASSDDLRDICEIAKIEAKESGQIVEIAQITLVCSHNFFRNKPEIIDYETWSKED